VSESVSEGERELQRVRVTRLADRAHYDRTTVDAILDEAYVAHVGVVVDGAPVVLPFACARVGDELVLHGSTRAGALSAVAAGAPVCATVTHLDGLVLARSGFQSSMNYRTAVVHGRARAITDPAEKIRLLDAFMDRQLPGRRAQVRGMSEGELQATQVVALPLDAVSAKVRDGGVKEPAEDVDPAVWAGVIPLRLVRDAPEPDPTNGPHAPPPP
jgi:nitroimidazol reductase NimA-like FMN-containing flavoprotein (pyridoxamine 5'-phosphate oxidase superfamily)